MKYFWIFFTSLSLLVFFSYAFIDPNFFPLERLYTGFAFDNREWSTALYVLTIIFLYSAYLCLLNLFLKKKINDAQIKALILFSSIILLFSYPAMLSYDIFNYLTTAKVLFHYFENPFLVMPMEFIGDSNLMFTHAANKLVLYGPSWIIITAAPYFLAAKNILLSLLTFKLLNISFYLATVYLFYKISKNLYSIMLFALNPLVLIETLLSNHNDIVMMFFALLGFYLLIKNKKIASFISISISILIKYATFFLLPVYIYSSYKKFRKEEINYDKVWIFSSYSMLLIFFLSSIREEIYPWYAIWFMVFAFISKNKFLKGLSIILPFFLLLRYTPFMYFGTHFGPTPIIKILLTFIPLVIYLFTYKFIKNSVFFKNDT